MNHDDSKIRVAIDEDLSDLIPGFLENRRKDLLLIRQALEGEDFEALRRIGHSMKGSGGGYGFDKISQIGKQLQMAAEEKDSGGVLQAHEALEFYLDNLEVVYVPDPED